MISPIVHDTSPVLLVGGGKHRKSALTQLCGLLGAPGKGACAQLVAADSGADFLLRRGLVPDWVIGDLDSISAAALTKLSAARIHKVNEQESTDFEKCLSRIAAPLVLGAGFLGGRLDHTLAAFHTLAALAERRCILIGARDIVFLAPPEITLALAPGTRVSLFPLGPVQATARGLRWPVEALDFDPLQQIGTSNSALGPVRLSCAAARLLVILPRSALGPALAGFSGCAAGWPPQTAL